MENKFLGATDAFGSRSSQYNYAGLPENKLVNPKCFFLKPVVSSLKSQDLEGETYVLKGTNTAPNQWNCFSMEGFNKCEVCVVHCIIVQSLFCSLLLPLPPEEDYTQTFMFLQPRSRSRELLSPQGGCVFKVLICSQGESWKRKDLSETEQSAMENNALGSYCRGRTRTH